MAQFVAINEKVEVNKQTVLSIVNSMTTGRERRLKILLNNGINPEEKEWFNQQNWLNAFKAISEDLGEMNLFLIGKAIIDNAEFPPIKDLEDGLRSIDVAYHMNHRLNNKVMFNPVNETMVQEIGNYKLIKFDANNKEALMVSNTPYPSKFDEGIIAQVVRKFRPTGAREVIKHDTTKETRKNGANSCTYSITW